MKYLAKFGLSFTKPDGKEWYCDAGETFDTADIELPDLADLISNHTIEEVKAPEPHKPTKGKKIEEVTT